MPSTTAPAFRLLLPTLCALAFIACGGDGGPDSEPGADAPPPMSYTVRGVVRSVPADGDARPQLLIHHEEIQGFVDHEGEETTMKAMSMPFPLGEGVELEGIQPGSRVEFTFEMDWAGSPAMELTAIRLLPEDSEETDSEDGEAGSEKALDPPATEGPVGS